MSSRERLMPLEHSDLNDIESSVAQKQIRKELAELLAGIQARSCFNRSCLNSASSLVCFDSAQTPPTPSAPSTQRIRSLLRSDLTPLTLRHCARLAF